MNKTWKRGAVYVIGPAIGRPLKVGRVVPGSSVEARLNALQSGSPVKLRIFYVRDAEGDSAGMEALAHFHLKECRIHGEWFDCSVATAVAAINYSIDELRQLDTLSIRVKGTRIANARTRAKTRRADAINELKQLLS